MDVKISLQLLEKLALISSLKLKARRYLHLILETGKKNKILHLTNIRNDNQMILPSIKTVRKLSNQLVISFSYLSINRVDNILNTTLLILIGSFRAYLSYYLVGVLLQFSNN